MVTNIMSKKPDSKKGVLPRIFWLSAKLWQKSADYTDVLSWREILKNFPLAKVERVFYHNNTSYEQGKEGRRGMQADTPPDKYI